METRICGQFTNSWDNSWTTVRPRIPQEFLRWLRAKYCTLVAVTSFESSKFSTAPFYHVPGKAGELNVWIFMEYDYVRMSCNIFQYYKTIHFHESNSTEQCTISGLLTLSTPRRIGLIHMIKVTKELGICDSKHWQLQWNFVMFTRRLFDVPLAPLVVFNGTYRGYCFTPKLSQSVGIPAKVGIPLPVEVGWEFGYWFSGKGLDFSSL